VIVHVSLAPVLLRLIRVRDVNVLNRRVVVIVGVRGQQVTPILPPMEIVGDVVVLVPVLDLIVLVMTAILLPHVYLPTRSPSA